MTNMYKFDYASQSQFLNILTESEEIIDSRWNWWQQLEQYTMTSMYYKTRDRSDDCPAKYRYEIQPTERLYQWITKLAISVQ